MNFTQIKRDITSQNTIVSSFTALTQIHTICTIQQTQVKLYFPVELDFAAVRSHVQEFSCFALMYYPITFRWGPVKQKSKCSCVRLCRSLAVVQLIRSKCAAGVF